MAHPTTDRSPGGDLPAECPVQELQDCLASLQNCIYTGKCDPDPELLEKYPALADLLSHIKQMQHCLTYLAEGHVDAVIPLQGYTGGIIRDLKANLGKIISQARQITVGDFSRSIDGMGDLSEAFNTMGRALQSALTRLELQKKDLTTLSENLQREVGARTAVEEHLRREQLRLEKLASTDPLTGIANRRHFFQIAMRETERIRRTGSRACLAMLDIDHFKELNDTLGHSAGDKALMDVARLISGVIRPYDVVGRYGGDEFVFLFPETPKDMAHAILERLRDSVEKAAIRSGVGERIITVSIGITDLQPADGKTAVLDQAILRADQALYQAKKHERNKISVL